MDTTREWVEYIVGLVIAGIVAYVAYEQHNYGDYPDPKEVTGYDPEKGGRGFQMLQSLQSFPVEYSVSDKMTDSSRTEMQTHNYEGKSGYVQEAPDDWSEEEWGGFRG